MQTAFINSYKAHHEKGNKNNLSVYFISCLTNDSTSKLDLYLDSQKKLKQNN